MSQNIAPLTTEVASDVLDTFSKLLRVLEKEDVAWEHLCLLINNRTARRNLAAYLRAGCPKMTAPVAGDTVDIPPAAHPPRAEYAQAIAILGDDFITPEEVADTRSCAYTEEQLAQFAATVPSKEVLKWCRDNGYMLIAGPPKPLSLLGIRELHHPYFYARQGGWYAETQQTFSREQKVTTKWLMLRQEPVPGSLNKTWEEQQSLLSPVEYVPNDAEVEWGVTTYKTVRNVFLLGKVYVRTSSVAAGGHHVSVGDFDAGGLGRRRPLGYPPGRRPRSRLCPEFGSCFLNRWFFCSLEPSRYFSPKALLYSRKSTSVRVCLSLLMQTRPRLGLARTLIF